MNGTEEEKPLNDRVLVVATIVLLIGMGVLLGLAMAKENQQLREEYQLQIEAVP